MTAPKRRTKPPVGWREWVVLPELSPIPMKAKIDTGARTSALHAFDLSIESHGGETWAQFEIHPVQRSADRSTRVRYPVAGFRRIRSSTGHTESRPMIRTQVKIGSVAYSIDITLTGRDEMGFRMLLGRQAIRRKFVVDPGRSFLQTPPTEPDPTDQETTHP